MRKLTKEDKIKIIDEVIEELEKSIKTSFYTCNEIGKRVSKKIYGYIKDIIFIHRIVIDYFPEYKKIVKDAYDKYYITCNIDEDRIAEESADYGNSQIIIFEEEGLSVLSNYGDMSHEELKSLRLELLNKLKNII